MRRMNANSNVKMKNETSDMRQPEWDEGKIDRCKSRKETLKKFGDLDGVQRGALEKLIARHPKRQTVIKSAIASYASNLAIVLACNIERHRIFVRTRFIHQF